MAVIVLEIVAGVAIGVTLIVLFCISLLRTLIRGTFHIFKGNPTNERLTTVPSLKLGKKDAIRPIGMHDLVSYTSTDSFPTPPSAVPAPAALWGMDGNDRLGDCTIAGVDHLIAAWNALFGEKDPRPTEPVLEGEYKKLSPDDEGCVEADVLADWRKPGMFGQQIHSYGLLDHRSPLELKQGVAFLGGVYLGIACPDSAQQQFEQQIQTGHMVPWTVVKGAQVEGGHCIVAVGYTTAGLLCVTWGAVVEVTWAFLKKYCDEAWAIISHELVEKAKDTLGIDVDQLAADLAALKVAA